MKQSEITKKQRVVIGVVGIGIFAALLGFVVRPMLEKGVTRPNHQEPVSRFESSWIEKLFGDNPQMTPVPTPPRFTEVAPPPVVYQPVEWPASSTINWELRNKLPQELIKKIDQSPVPVLLPGDVALAREARVFLHENWNLIHIERLGSDFSMTINRTNFDPTKANITHTIRDNPGRISVHSEKGTRYVTWIENGVMYDLEMSCGEYACSDKRSEASMLELVNNLKYVGGIGWKDGR